MTDIEDKYFGKYRSVGATNQYLDSLSPDIREVVEQAGEAAPKRAREPSPEGPSDPAPSNTSAAAPAAASSPSDATSTEIPSPEVVRAGRVERNAGPRSYGVLASLRPDVLFCFLPV